MDTIKKVFEEGNWFTTEEINNHQINPLEVTSPLSEWEQCGRVYSVLYDDKKYYARYQFDSACQPLPIIKDILDAYGVYLDPWSIAAWFHFPNGWIIDEQSNGAVPVSPKNALDRRREVISAARNHKGTYES